ncbi:thiol-disulfide isomerase/thioredoxin [Kordia periserrulae]|uniref:Thiol-disulfide isomerase/thioredoxin n=1 Tax=Kordia periserrulae TaxID=701523 RepID=A0A2T6C5I4_9FLAO|nr:TlpA disulfide reductase family protein [Kordia periserrulae]PTX63557.1 thiol-disulfide isomerase/thioredoxin [Kordia periserrulae]
MKSIMSFVAVFLLFTIQATAQKEIPNVEVKNLDGTSLNMNQITQEKGVKILSFWATWCVPCINELDAINEVYEDWQDETNVELIAIATDDSRTKKRIKPLINGKGWEYKILLDDNQDLQRALNITTIPHVIVIKDGEIVFRHTGYFPGAENQLYDVVKKNSK